ncbi:pentapeptide repeat-containing protein [Frankia sp. AgB1.9]|uniref:pentapeptide repeat-containing protein n=1 Tax=unclassified Frankia TaxID=2632575 RepID=UPI001933E015|nr:MULTISPECIES: pentapeptide repeat-containing protein [unclassified Frankia]MBL7490347.1 pentapeptide repeat-containing protein [Frankia sp. AgW1.1]MBL7552761.1 pentapeptide repeat-containing protein [Frankia sp. AgB1.9]MBL7625354.1 pentapeptide repeat-containing protein [Frankia sp. AgB1.8]
MATTARRRGDPWAPVVPDLPTERPGAASPGPAEPVELADLLAATGDGTGRDVRLVGARLARLRVVGGDLSGVTLRDVAAREVALAGTVADGGAATRVAVDGGRLSGAVWVSGEIHDARLTGVRADGLTLRFCRLHRCRFEDCDLTGLDLTRSRLDHVEFIRCDLTGADFSGMTVVAARFADCRFDRVTGADGLAGAQVGAGDLVGLAPSLATALGIVFQ